MPSNEDKRRTGGDKGREQEKAGKSYKVKDPPRTSEESEAQRLADRNKEDETS